MNYWWVNQKQTHRHEIGDGYMWSPKKQSDGKPNYSYECMKRIQPGDVVFSYANSTIIAVGVSRTHCYSFPKPVEFGNAGVNWANEGWKVDVNYRRLAVPLRTKEHINVLRPLLPVTRSPLQSNTGNANQAYLFKIEQPLALAIAHLIDQQTVMIVNGNFISESDEIEITIDAHIDEWENRIEDDLLHTDVIPETQKEAIILARRGQGKFRELLLNREPRCRVTGVDKPEHLIASHIKPWRSGTNEERLDAENGFMLTPSIDHLFDKGFISFENNGSILLADVADRNAMERMGVIGGNAPENIGLLIAGQKKYLEWHRDNILLK